MKKRKILNYGRQWIDDEDIRGVVQVLESDFLTQGPRVQVLENALSEYVGSKYAVAVSSGTAALHLAVKALEIERGKVGMTSPNTFVASANCFLYCGLEPSFADIDEKTYCISPEEISKRIDARTGIIIPVHYGGQPAEMERIHGMAFRKNIPVIEDATHAIGSKYENGASVGSCCFSQMTVFSFHPIKTVTTGEGGAITTNRPDLYERLSMLRNHGITKDREKFHSRKADTGLWYYEMQELGFNYRMTDLQAALGFSQLKKCRDFVKRRREIACEYTRAFGSLDWITPPFERPGVFSAYHLYPIKIDFEKIGKTRAEVVSGLKEEGIQTQVHYIPVHLQPYYRKNFGFKPGDYPRAERYYEQCLSIPLFPKMTDKEVEKVIRSVRRLKT